MGPRHVFVGVDATLMVAVASEERPGGVVVLGYSQLWHIEVLASAPAATGLGVPEGSVCPKRCSKGAPEAVAWVMSRCSAHSRLLEAPQHPVLLPHGNDNSNAELIVTFSVQYLSQQ